jgi:hypothetical protein
MLAQAESLLKINDNLLICTQYAAFLCNVCSHFVRKSERAFLRSHDHSWQDHSVNKVEKNRTMQIKGDHE